MARKSDETALAFAREYHVDRNGTRAARAAGLSGDDNVLAISATRFLKDPRVKRELRRLDGARSKRTRITADHVVRELARLGFSDIRDAVTWDRDGKLVLKPSARLPKRIARAIKSITEKVTPGGTVITSITLHDKVKPLELLGRHTGALTPKPDADADEAKERVIVELPDNGRDREDD